MMRVSKDTHDEGFMANASERRVWHRGVEVLSWVTADEFRRVIITSSGQVLNGDVLVERLPSDSAQPLEEPQVAEIPVTSMQGLFEVPKATEPLLIQNEVEVAKEWPQTEMTFDHDSVETIEIGPELAMPTDTYLQE